MEPDAPIDAVITWVDGSDPAHQAKMREVLSRERLPRGTIRAGLDASRFADNNEIEYCVRSLRRFAPWIRHIHIVTDDQCPRFLTPGERQRLGVKIVDHRVIFEGYEWALPTFNERSIATLIWRVPGLAKYFLYLNDDFILLRNVTPRDFFELSQPVIRGQWRRMRNRISLGLGVEEFVNRALRRLLRINRTMTLHAQMEGARRCGYQRWYYRVPHVPHAHRLSTFQQFFEGQPTVLQENIRYRFRHLSQFAPSALAHHIDIWNGNADLWRDSGARMINGERDSRRSLEETLKAIEQERVEFLCLQGMESVPSPYADRVRQVLRNKIGVVSESPRC